MHAGRLLIKIKKSRRHTRDIRGIRILIEVIHPLHHPGQDIMKVLKPCRTAGALLANLKDLAFGLIQNLAGLLACRI